MNPYQTRFTRPPGRIPSQVSVDAPLLGNGDMTAVLGGGPGDLAFHLGKNDLWRLQHGNTKSSPVPFGQLTLACAALSGGGYQVTQDLLTAHTRGSFEGADASLRMDCFVAATENLLVIELEAAGKAIPVHIGLRVAEGRGSVSETGRRGDVSWGRRAFEADVDIPTGVAAALALTGADPGPDGHLLLEPGCPVTLLLSMRSLFQSGHYLEDAVAAVSRADAPSSLNALRGDHEAWWRDYWSKSSIHIGDPLLEKLYAVSLYGMASCSRDPDFPPGVFGWTTDDHPKWNGDYHLNYNHQSPFYGLAQANRLEQADPHDAPLLDFLERGRWHCREIFGFDGVVYPVGIGPRGIETTYGIELEDLNGVKRVEHGCFLLGQRTNAAYGIPNMAARWHCTLDPAYGRRILPYVVEVATFWENYLNWDEEGQRFVIENDSCHESSGPDFNAGLSLALVRASLELAVELCRALDRDTRRVGTWEHILQHLSGFSVQEREGKTVFRYCERGTDWREDNTIGIQHIYPAGQVHLDSDPELLQTARNTLELMGRWQNSNGANSFFPAAVRVGCDPRTILRELRRYAEDTWPNGFRVGNPHGIESWSTVPNTLHEMLCMSHGGVIRVFAVWPKECDAGFQTLRCRGAFLVSSQLKDGVILFVEIFSEKGRPCTLENPWPDAAALIQRANGETEVHSGRRICFDTGEGELLRLVCMEAERPAPES